MPDQPSATNNPPKAQDTDLPSPQARWWIPIVGRLVLLALGLGVAFLLVVSLEWVAKSQLVRSGLPSYPLIYNNLNQASLPSRWKRQAEPKVKTDFFKGLAELYTEVDPHLGYEQADAFYLDQGLDRIKGFVVYGREPGKKKLRIAALGGSTTDPKHKHNWPKQLQKILVERGIDTEVFNGGVSGYSSNQELLKLIRDVLPLKPDLVISLNGINDANFAHAINEHPMVLPYQRRLLAGAIQINQPIWMPNTMSWLRPGTQQPLSGVAMGPKVATTPEKQWRRNIRLMHAACNAFDIQYHCFLQPTVGTGSYEAAEKINQMLHEYQDSADQYLQGITRFYDAGETWAENTAFVSSLVSVFDGHQNMYEDPRHPNADGYGIIAQGMTDQMVSNGKLAPTTSKPANLLRSADDITHRAWSSDDSTTISFAVTKTPNGQGSTHHVKMRGKSNLLQAIPGPALPGATFRAEAWLWGTPGQKIQLILARHGKTEPESKAVTVTLSSKPTHYEIEHRFEHKHDLIRFQLQTKNKQAVDFYLWEPGLFQVKPPHQHTQTP